MPKPDLIYEDEQLVSDLIKTFIEGHKQYRPDLGYPESHSDMKGGMMALLRMFKIERRGIAIPNKIKCHHCHGRGKFETMVNNDPNHVNVSYCGMCNRQGYTTIF